MIYILAGLVGCCAVICAAAALERLWDRLSPAQKESAPCTAATVQGAESKNVTFSIDKNKRAVKPGGAK